MNPEFQHQAETKLYIPRDVEGKPSREELQTIKEAEKKLSKIPGFVGLAPFGSVVSGYENNASDIDLGILYDSQKDANAYKLLDEYRKTVSEELSKNSKREVNFGLIDINTKNLIEDLNTALASQKEITNSPWVRLADMSMLVTGKKIEKQREIIKQELLRLSLEQQQEIASQIMNVLESWDNFSLTKRKERIPELSEQEHQEIMEKRKEMWKHRVEKVWGLKNEE